MTSIDAGFAAWVEIRAGASSNIRAGGHGMISNESPTKVARLSPGSKNRAVPGRVPVNNCVVARPATNWSVESLRRAVVHWTDISSGRSQSVTSVPSLLWTLSERGTSCPTRSWYGAGISETILISERTGRERVPVRVLSPIVYLIVTERLPAIVGVRVSVLVILPVNFCDGTDQKAVI